MMSSSRRVAAAVAIVSALSALACTDPARPELDRDPARLVISASVVGTPISTLVARITAPDIPIPIVKNLIIQGGVASGTLMMPPGLARTITVTAFDDDSEISHEGSRTIDVRRGTNPAVVIPMIPRAGEVPVTVQIGSVLVTLSSTSARIPVGGVLQLSATVQTADGELLTNTAEWATTAPGIAGVSATGLVTGLRAGRVSIVASFAGVAAVAMVDVTDGLP